MNPLSTVREPVALPPSIEAIRERLDLAAPAFREALARLERLDRESPEYRALAESILERAPSEARLREVRGLALMLGPHRAEARALELARLALLPKDSDAARALRGGLVSEKVSHDFAMDALEQDEEAAEAFRSWQLALEELYE